MASPDALLRLLRYLGAGGASLVVYYAIYVGLTQIWGVWYVAAALSGFVGYVVVNFSLQKYWTFRDKDHSRFMPQLGCHLLLHSVGQIMNLGGLYLLIDYWGLLGEVLAQFIMTTYLTIQNWVASRYWIFKERDLRQ